MYVNDTQTTTVKHNGKVLSEMDGHWQRRTFEVNEPVHAEPSINGSYMKIIMFFLLRSLMIFRMVKLTNLS